MPTRTKPSAPAATGALTAAAIPVTRAMLGSVRTEVLQRIDQSREETKADNEKLGAKIGAVDAKIDAVKTELKTEIHEVKAEIHEVKAQMARIELLFEEQNARNKIVLDGITALLGRQDQVEQRVSQVEDTVRKLASAPRAPEPSAP